MATVGRRLRHERESRGKTLEELGEASGIGVAFLEALERDDFNALPGRAFGKLYIRAYGEALGFDPQPLIDDYDREQRLVPDDGRRWRPEPIEGREEPENAPPAASVSTPRVTTRVVVLACVAVALVAAGFYSVGRRAEDAPAPSASPVEPVAAPVAPSPTPASPPVVEPPKEAPAPAPMGHLRVTESGLGRRVVAGRLEGESDRFAPGEVAWFQTRVVGGRGGEVVRHVWLHDGKPQQTIALPLRGADWRTHSNKTLYTTGPWTVEARDAEGRVLASAAFTCEASRR